MKLAPLYFLVKKFDGNGIDVAAVRQMPGLYGDGLNVVNFNHISQQLKDILQDVIVNDTAVITGEGMEAIIVFPNTFCDFDTIRSGEHDTIFLKCSQTTLKIGWFQLCCP